MDPLSAIGAVIDLASAVNDVLCYIDSVTKAPQDIQRTRDEIASYLTLLECVRRFIGGYEHDPAPFVGLLRPGGPLEASMKALQDLNDIVGGDRSNQNSRDRIRTLVSGLTNLSFNDVTWPLKQKRINDICQRLERQKSSITMALTLALSTARYVLNIRITTVGQIFTQALDEMRATNQRLTVMERRNILHHCLPADGAISTIHKNRKAQQEAETCEWVSREERFMDWLKPHNTPTNRSRFICIHGIPGAGKTVLASSLVETAAVNCSSRGYAYYYCLYSRKQDETVPFLKWVLRQLCKQQDNTVPTKLKDAYDREEGLSIQDLLDCLQQVSLTYENGVYIIVDAVDESKPRENILKVLSQIGTEERFWKVSLLFTSREESEIMAPIHELGNSCACISMSNKNVRDDIKRYVHAQLTQGGFLFKWDDDAFLEEVETTLTQKAKGMFRWAVCQLDVLKRKRGNSESIRQALEALPEDIFATYERILVEIPQVDQEFAKTALALICSDTARIPAAEVLVPACLYSVPFNIIGRYSVPMLKEACGSLISLSYLNKAPWSHFTRDNEEIKRFHRCTLAHYTVKEYLFSPSAASGPARFFALSDQIVKDIDLKVIFTGLSHFGLYRTSQNRQNKNTLSRHEEYCLRMTEYSLRHRRNDILRNEEVREIVIRALTPTSRHFIHLKSIVGIKTIMRNHFPQWNSISGSDLSLPIKEPVGLLVNLAILRWEQLADQYLKRPEFKDLPRKGKTEIWAECFKLGDKKETILGYCLREGHLDFLHVLLNHGASFEHEPEALYMAMRALQQHPDRSPDLLQDLLNAGASHNPTLSISGGEGGFAFTPLQLAVYLLEYEWVDLLLEENADVNMIGDPSKVIPSSWKGSDEAGALQAIALQSALEICSDAQPAWVHRSGSNASRARESIRELLRRHGAEEPADQEMEEADGDPGDMDIDVWNTKRKGEAITDWWECQPPTTPSGPLP
ncbi:hypothetical protein F5Y10DRAFT_275455 [Nemania abortiva]|nr:hypothetical protein F5Y10DRAFT_275455 [Nemania abortiva]